MHVRLRSFVASLGAAVVVGGLLSQPGSAVASGPGAVPAAATDAPAARALDALAQAADVVEGGPAGLDASLTMLGLARAQADLPAGRRAEARRLLARPTDGAGDPEGVGYQDGAHPTRSCQGRFCVHWARATSDRPDLTDANRNGRPDYVDRVLATLGRISGTYARAGYRRPVGDGPRGGGTDQLDVYLVDSGARGIYGYCAPEGVTSPHQRTAPAYCAIDNDFAEFPAHSPVANMQVTLAHEYFHAVQFAYDLTDDRWFLEATAAWVEDELFDDVDDNRQYLHASALSHPHLPLDRGDGSRDYGGWIFFRFLSELEPSSRGGLPTIVRDVWRRAAGPISSIHAVEAVLARRGHSLTTVLARFAAANRTPARSYTEGSGYPVAKPASSRSVPTGTERRDSVRLAHLSSRTVRYRPASGSSPTGRLQVHVELPDRDRPTAAVVSTRRITGSVRTRIVRVDRTGAGRVTVPFSGARIAHVEVTLVNASTRFACFRGTSYSCEGRPLDDDLPLRVRVRAVR